MQEIYRDRDYIQDVKGNIYQVIGSIHPENGIYALQKYQNLSKGEASIDSDNSPKTLDPISRYKSHEFRTWVQKPSGHQFYRILPNYSSLSASNNIKENPYRRFSSIFGIDMIIIPKDQIRTHYLPVTRLQNLIRVIQNGKFTEKNALDPLERKAADVAIGLASRFDIPINQIGITGSILWHAQHELSDIDLMVYGNSNGARIIRTYGTLSSERKGLRRLLNLEMLPLADKMAIKTGLPADECFEYIYHKKTLFMFNDIKISVTFAPSLSDLLHYPLINPDSRIKTLTPITVRARIISEKWGLFYPSLFHIEVKEIIEVVEKNMKISLDTLHPTKIRRLMVYEHEIVGYYHEGDTVEIRGLLQEIQKVPDFESLIPTNGYQILIGANETFGNEYVRIIK